MQYIKELFPVIPFVLFLSVLVCRIVHRVRRHKKIQVTRLKSVSECLLLTWLFLFIYVTQIKSFGNGFGELYNLTPFHDFYIAFRYGSNNASMIWQSLLNIMMFMPLGFLLPLAFSDKVQKWRHVLVISFSLTVITELVQLVSRRGTDINDVIANTVGGLCGFALFWCVLAVLAKAKSSSFGIKQIRQNLFLGILILISTAVPFVLVCFADGFSKYGTVYYGQLKPSTITTGDLNNDYEEMRKVYQYAPIVTREELQDKLTRLSGISGEFEKNDDAWMLVNGENSIVVFPHHTWQIDFESTSPSNTRLSTSDALSKAIRYLEQYEIESVEYVEDVSKSYEDNQSHLKFRSIPDHNADNLAYGNVMVTLGSDGALISLSDERIFCSYDSTERCISPQQAISIAKEVGHDASSLTVQVLEVVEDFCFIEETGYLVPAWRIISKTEGVSVVGEDEYRWEPLINAVK